MIRKIKTSVSLSQSLLEELAPFNKNGNISQFIEHALTSYLAELKRQGRREQDKELLKAHAVRFSKEAEENLEFQDMP
ncbi:MAG: type II toxin-antitoxin system CcdA family antitoxin [Treponema sp.]|jgi:metal-responsive CopG/Arc/MetJ family transcriptional regulator|nr:type II toxin-antitoxin system CcdA family antitoxin [Treponema sp.]